MKKILLVVAVLVSGTGNARSGLENYFSDTLNQARQGDSVAMYDAAGMYVRGVGTERDITKGLYWYREAALAGDATGAFKLGQIYSEGILISVDTGKAFHWYKRAALQGNKRARSELAAMYLAGKGVERDPETAAKWLDPEWPKIKSAPKSYVASKPLSTFALVANTQWFKKNHHVAYLPSKSTYCVEDGNELVCTSKKISGQQFNKRYTYRVRSRLKNFTPDGHFDADIEFQLVDVSGDDVGGYDSEDDDIPVVTTQSIVHELQRRKEKVSCEFSQDEFPIICISQSGRRVAYSDSSL